MPYANHQGIRIHYKVEGEGPPLVLHHGFTGNLEGWYEFGYVEALKHDYQLILMDARGHGASDKPHEPAAYALPVRVGDVVAVLDHLHLRQAHFFGYSMGGTVGFGLAKYAPERVHTLIIGGAAPSVRTATPFHQVDGSDPEVFIAALETLVGERFTPDVKAKMLRNDTRALAAFRQQPSVFLEDVLPRMTMPCLLYAGEADAFYPSVQACAQSIPQVTFVSFPQLNHIEAVVRADLTVPHITKFLDTTSQGAPTAVE